VISKRKESSSAACIYLACRVEGYPRTLDEVSLATGVEVKLLSKVQKQIVRGLQLPVGRLRPLHLLNRMGTRAHCRHSVIVFATEICKNVARFELFETMPPQVVVAGSLFVASVLLDQPIDTTRLATVTLVPHSQLKLVYKAMHPMLSVVVVSGGAAAAALAAIGSPPSPHLSQRGYVTSPVDAPAAVGGGGSGGSAGAGASQLSDHQSPSGEKVGGVRGEANLAANRSPHEAGSSTPPVLPSVEQVHALVLRLPAAMDKLVAKNGCTRPGLHAMASPSPTGTGSTPALTSSSSASELNLQGMILSQPGLEQPDPGPYGGGGGGATDRDMGRDRERHRGDDADNDLDSMMTLVTEASKCADKYKDRMLSVSASGNDLEALLRAEQQLRGHS
jgi:hypothetical protein